MPRYEHTCPKEHTFESVRKMSTAGEPQPCPTCGEDAPQVISRIAPQHDKMDRLGDARLLDD